MNGSDKRQDPIDGEDNAVCESENGAIEMTDGARAQAVAAQDKRRTYLLGIAMAGIFIAFIAVGAYINIPIGTIKITMQFLVTNICVLLLGKKWGTLTVALYVFLGLCGLPIFSDFSGGFAYALKPSFGFLIGFVVGGFFASWYREKTGKNTFGVYMTASMINLVIMDIIGTVYGAVIMYGYMHSTMGAWAFLMTFLLPFIPIDIAKCAVGSVVCCRLYRFGLAERRAS